MYLLATPAFLFAAPVALLAAVVTTRHPAAAVIGIFALTGAIGTLTAFTPIPVTKLTDFLLLAAWLAVAGTYLFGTAERRPWLWPGLIAPGLYLVISALQVTVAEPVDLGYTSFRASTWYLAAALLVAVAPWRRETMIAIARGVVAVGLAIGAYSTFRWLTGVSTEEYLAQRLAAPRLDDRFAGSMLSANQLSAWAGTVIPFAVAIGMAWRGKLRVAAFAGVALLAVALLASDVRAGVAAAALGTLIAMLLHQVSPAFPRRVGVGLLTALVVATVSVGAYAIAVEGTERADRLESLLDPEDDATYSERLRRWEEAVDVIGSNPLGLGLGTVGEVAVQRNEAGSAVDTDLDNSYLKIGLEQGVVVMALFILAMAGVGGGLAVVSIRTRDPWAATLTSGACGTLGALLVLFYGGLYIEGMPIVAAWLLVGLGLAQATTRRNELGGA